MRLAYRLSYRRAPRHALLTAAAALFLTGCATVHPHSAAPPAPVGTAGAPASALATRQAQDRLLKAAEQRLVADCLDAQGLALPPAPVSQARAPAAAPGPAPSDADTRLQTALFGRDPRELSHTLSTGHTVTANSDGCVAAARGALYGDQHRWFRAQVTVDNLRAEAHARMKDDPAHRAALDRWTRCAAPSGGPRTGRPDPAVAERCTRESGLGDVRARLEPVELATVRTLHRDEVATYEQLRSRALRRAAELSAKPTEKTAPSEKKGTDAS